MGGQQQHKKSKVVKIDSMKSWEEYINEATNKGYFVSLINSMVIHFIITMLHEKLQQLVGQLWFQLQIALRMNSFIFILLIKYLQVMVHFSAYWCMPSIAMDPFFEELASTYQNIIFLKVDVDEVKVIYVESLQSLPGL